MKTTDKDTWLKEYTEFVQSDDKNISVPSEIFGQLKSRLFPNPWKIFGKILTIHGVVGFLSLGVCNQFGLNPFNTEYSLVNWLMKVGGHNFCMIACGVIFMTTTYLLANFVLNLEELETIRRYEWLQTGILGVASLAAFYFFGAELIITYAVLWVLGAFLGGFLSIEGSYRLRRNFAL